MPTVNKAPQRPWLVKKLQTPKKTPAAFEHMVETRFYRTQPWFKLRRRILDREPFCRECVRQDPDSIELATMVDHIIPIKQGGEKLDVNNCQPLCEKCHAKKRNSERKPTKR